MGPNTTTVLHSLLASKSLSTPTATPSLPSPSSNSSLDANLIISLLPKVASNSLHQKTIGKFNNCHISCGKNITEPDYYSYSHGSGSGRDGGHHVGAFRRYSLPIMMITKHVPDTSTTWGDREQLVMIQTGTTTTKKPVLRQQRRNEAGLDIENLISPVTEEIWRKTKIEEKQFQFQDEIRNLKTHRNCSIIQHLDSF